MRISREIAPLALWVMSVALVAGTIRLGATAVTSYPVQVAAVGRAPEVPALPDRVQLLQQADSLRQRNPFRLERTPTSQPYCAPEIAVPPAIEQPPQPKPVLSVGGIVGGPPWKALIEGIPGREPGILLAVGEEWNGFRLVWVRRDSVKVVAPDTTWVLGLKRVWR